MASAARLLLFVAAAALVAASFPAASALPCRGHAQTLLISFSSVSRPNPDPANPSPLTTTVVTVLRVRRLGPHHGLHLHQPHLQIRRPAEPLPASADPNNDSEASSRAKDILVVVFGLLFGFGCGALTASSMYLVWSLIASIGANGSSAYDEVYGDDYEEEEEEEGDASDGAESPKKAGYVIIHDAEVYGGGKN